MPRQIAIFRQNEISNAKTRLKAPPTLCIPTIFKLSAPKLTKSICFINSTTERARASSNSDFPPKRNFKRRNEVQGPAHTLYTNDFRTQHPKIDLVYLFYKFYHRESTHCVKQRFPAKTRFQTPKRGSRPRPHSVYQRFSNSAPQN